ncbi:hypothetical protein LSAT2_023139 [Lamellibrachia satsuma]|nr:hypothetical protein LSAT2_023139 [Lamellibrachia satsuma]
MVTSSASSDRDKCPSTSLVAGSNKRRHPTADLGDYRAAKRLSPLLNTPKQRKEEKRRILRLSAQKLRETQDPESCLRRSVLVNNTLLRIQRELRDDGPPDGARANCRRYLSRHDSAPWLQDTLNQSYLYSNAHLFEDHVTQWSDTDDRVPSDVGATLDRNMRNLLGNGCLVPTVCKTSSPSPMTSQVQLGCCAVDDQSAASGPHGVATATESDLHCCHVTALCMKSVATDVVKDCVASDRTFDKRDSVNSIADCYCGNLTEAERLVLGELDTVFSNLISVLTNS